MSADQPWVAIQRNPTSGSGGAKRELLSLVHHLFQHDLRPRIFTRRERLAAALADPRRRASLICIVAAGGDGTFRDIVNRYPGIRVAVLPMGTENLVAKYFKIPRNGRLVADLIVAKKFATFDLGRFGDRKFAVMATAGFDADIMHRAHAKRRGHINRWSYLQPIWDSLRKYHYPQIRVYLDDAAGCEVCRQAVLVNFPSYALGINMARTARGDDGLFDVRTFANGSALQMWKYFICMKLGVHDSLSDVRAWSASRVRWESDVPVPIQVDGDPAGFTPAEFEILPNAVEIVIP